MRPGREEMKLIHFFGLVLVWLPAFAQPPAKVSANDQRNTPLLSRSIYRSKSTWEAQNGEKATLSKLRGNPVVAAMIYTSCKASCPLMMTDLKAIDRALSSDEKKKVHFAIFAFDSKNDLPEQLKLFSDKSGVDSAHWTFFHGSPSSVRELAALLGVKFKQLEDGGFDHSNVISILDAEGVIARQQIGLRQNPEESIKLLKQLIESK